MLEDVADSGLGHEASDRGVRTSVITEVDEAAKSEQPIAVGAVLSSVGPLVEQGLDEADHYPFHQQLSTEDAETRTRMCHESLR
jgi:hypothetical protein